MTEKEQLEKELQHEAKVMTEMKRMLTDARFKELQELQKKQAEELKQFKEKYHKKHCTIS